MSHLFVKLENNKIINLNSVISIIKSDNPYKESNYLISTTTNEYIHISQKEYEHIENFLFGDGYKSRKIENENN